MVCFIQIHSTHQQHTPSLKTSLESRMVARREISVMTLQALSSRHRQGRQPRILENPRWSLQSFHITTARPRSKRMKMYGKTKRTAFVWTSMATLSTTVPTTKTRCPTSPTKQTLKNSTSTNARIERQHDSIVRVVALFCCQACRPLPLRPPLMISVARLRRHAKLPPLARQAQSTRQKPKRTPQTPTASHI